MKEFIVILCGGSGTRLWPLSTKAVPKQFIDLLGTGETMIQATVRRARGSFPDAEVVVVTSADQEHLVKQQINAATVLVEPVARNTAAAIGLAAVYVLSKDKNGMMVVLPCDHYFGNEAELSRVLRLGTRVAAHKEMLVTIGIAPDHAHPQLGYIQAGEPLGSHQGVSSVKRFHEKPGQETAEQYLKDGGWCWNSGMFVWKAADIIAAINTHVPQLGAGLGVIVDSNDGVFGTLVSDIYPSLPSISIDHGVMQKASNRIAMVEARDIRWKDIGSWSVLSEFWPVTGKENLFVGGVTDVTLTIDEIKVFSEDCLVHSDGEPVVVVGLKEVAVLRANGRILVCPTALLPKIGEVTKKLPPALQ